MNKKWLVMATIFLGLLISIPSFAGEGKGPVCSLNFDQGEGLVVKDASGNNNNGAILNEGKYTKWGEGKVGKALEFTAGDQAARSNNGCVAVAGTDKYDFTKGLTVEAWVKFNDKWQARSDSCEIISNTFSDYGKGFRFRIAWNSLQLLSGDGDASLKLWSAASNSAQNPIVSNTWYHIAGTYDGSLFKVYLNGEEVGVSEKGLALTEGQKTIYIGAYNGGYAYGFNGTIDEVTIYDYARSALDILKDAKLSLF
ncbi:MAG: LamG domain-containing protein [Candidatus Omnitrophica bacterium]|nr:LamG domain-containing protein [Candidatus Omnitrophota bacterium]